MRGRLTPLSDLIEGYPAEAPQWLDELAETKGEELEEAIRTLDDEMRQLIYELRAHALDIKQGAVREAALATPDAVSKALRAGQLRPPANRWICYPLDKRRRRIPAAHKTSGSRFVCQITPKVPKAEDLHAVEHGGGYLLVWGGDPEVLEIQGVMPRIAQLARNTELFDVVFFERHTGRVTSLRLGKGDENGRLVDTINEDTAQEAKNIWQ